MQPPDEDSPAVRLWVDVIRPTFSHDSEPYGPFEPPDEKVERLRRTFWNETILIGPGLAKKYPRWAEKLRAQEDQVIYLSGHYRHTLLDLPGVGYLTTPRHGDQRAELERLPWAVDTGCFTQPKAYTRDGYFAFLKARRYALATCLFATAPDVVGDAVATWNRSRDVLCMIRILGYQAAFVAQNGIEREVVHWDAFDVLFLGGTTGWKLSHHARDLTAEALRRGIPVHMGRVNSYRRLQTAKMWGCASCDGTLLIFGHDANLPRIRWWLEGLREQPPLNFGGDACSA